MKTKHRVFKKGWILYENTCVKNHLPFDICISVEMDENRELEIVVMADEEVKGKLEEE